MFIHTINSGYIPLASIVRATENWREEKVAISYRVGNEIHRADVCDAFWQRTIVSMIPAQPETYLLWPCISEGKPDASKSLVIGWGLTVAGHIAPITAEGAWDESSHALPILHPNGTVEILSDATYDTYDEWIEARRRGAEAQTGEVAAG